MAKQNNPFGEKKKKKGGVGGRGEELLCQPTQLQSGYLPFPYVILL